VARVDIGDENIRSSFQDGDRVVGENDFRFGTLSLDDVPVIFDIIDTRERMTIRTEQFAIALFR
jgi:hypothetical protein